MKQTYFALFLLVILGITSCRKDDLNIDIKTYDQQQIDGYIKTNNLSNMKRDLTDGDTTGIYYEILTQGKGAAVDYPDRLNLVYSIKSFDGLYLATDTINNHSYNYLGSMAPKGLMLALRNIIKNKGTRARLLIPSRLAYGSAGSGTGSSRLRGNQSLEYYVNLLDETKQDAYDELSIRKYASASGIDLSTYTRSTTGLFYKVTQAGTGTVYPTPNSTITIQYTGSLLNNYQFDISSNAVETGISSTVSDFLPGFAEGLQKGTAGSKISLFIPSKLVYGVNGSVDGTSGATIIPPNSVLRFEINLLTVTN